MTDSNIHSLREAIKLSPDNIPLLILYGNACIESWNLDEARQAFNRVLNLQPEHSDAQLGIILILYKMGKISEALVRIEALNEKKGLDPQGFLLYSKILLASDNREQAKEIYQQVMRKNPQLVDSEYESSLMEQCKSLPSQSEEKVENQQERIKLGADDEPSDDSDITRILTDIEQANGSRGLTTFTDVGGMESVKEEIKMKILYPLNNKELFKAYGKKIGGGVLLYGPPGCGKTLVSRAMAGEMKGEFFAIGIHQILDMYLGNSEKNLHEIFELARSHTPAVLFIDEVDALASDRSHLKYSSGRTLINQFLSEMDGIDSQNEGFLIIAATNAPWHLDPAFRRPGRFDRILFVPPPDEPARSAILRILLKDKPNENLDINKLSMKTKGFSGADLKAVIDLASEQVLTQAMKANRVIPLTTKIVQSTIKKVKPSTTAWFETAKNYALFSNQSGFYDDVLTYLGISK